MNHDLDDIERGLRAYKQRHYVTYAQRRVRLRAKRSLAFNMASDYYRTRNVQEQAFCFYTVMLLILRMTMR
jgi:hypothetical protein